MKHRRLKREHGRILSVETKVRGSALSEDTVAAATSLTVDDAADFDEDGGWLTINGQVVAYTECDDEAGVITLAEGLTGAAEGGDQVAVWSTLYAEVVDFQEAEVVLDGVYDNPEPVVAEVAEGVGELPTGDRGEAGESCTLLRVSDDEWEVVGVGGRPKKSSGVRAEMHDVLAVTASGPQTFTLSHTPINEGLILEWCPAAGAGIYQKPANYTVDYSAGVISFPDTEGLLAAEDELRVWYLYRKGFRRGAVYDIGQSPYSWPSGTSPDTLAVLAVVVPTEATVGDLNGWTQDAVSSVVTHMASSASLSVQLYLFTRQTTSGATPLPTITQGPTLRDIAWMLAVIPGTSLNTGAAVGSVADATTASTPDVPDADKVLRVWVALGDNPHITTTATLVGEDNPPRNPAASVDYVNVFALDPTDGAPVAASTTVSCGWLTAAVPLSVA